MLKKGTEIWQRQEVLSFHINERTGRNYMRVLAFISLGAIIAMATPVDQTGAAQEAGRAPMQVQVDLSATLGAANLEGLRGVCVWNLPSDSADPMHKAWVRAGLAYPRWPWLGHVEVSWQPKDDGSRAMVLNFDALDAILADCRKMGIEPLFSVGGTPTALLSNSDVEIKEYDNPSAYAPADYAQWGEFVSRIISRVVEKGYRGGYYEVGNEPEDYESCWRGKPGSTNADTLADYIELYLHSARAIKAADPSAKVGGPVCAHWDSVTASGGAHAWGLPQFLCALAKYRQEHPGESMPLDFVDWHDYSYMSPRLSDGVDFVDKILAEAKWPTRPEYLITEWNLSGEGITLYQRASHAACNIIREANPTTRRIARLYWYVLDGGGDGALVDAPAVDVSQQDSLTRRSYVLSPTFAVFEMFGQMNRGSCVRVNVEEPLAALATKDETSVRLMVNNNTAEKRTASVEVKNLPAQFQNARCRVQLVDEQHSADGDGLERGKETAWQADRPVFLELAPYSTALVTMKIQ